MVDVEVVARLGRTVPGDGVNWGSREVDLEEVGFEVKVKTGVLMRVAEGFVIVTMNTEVCMTVVVTSGFGLDCVVGARLMVGVVCKAGDFVVVACVCETWLVLVVFADVLRTEDVATTETVLVGARVKVVGSVTLKVLSNPKTASAAPSSTHPTLTPSVFSIGKAKHLEFFAHCSSTKAPLEHVPFAPLTQAI